MPIKISDISLGIDETIDELKNKAAKKLKVSKDNIKDLKVIRESIDARKKNDIKLKYTVEVNVDKVDKEKRIVDKAKVNSIKLVDKIENEIIEMGSKKLNERPIIVGMGPAGMFCALFLARMGYKPLVIERGSSVDDRTKEIDLFWKSGQLDINSNVQFGEGGAGTFSDGKLTTRIKDKRCNLVLDQFVKYGAPEEIKYLGKPHIGTDILKEVVKNIRKEIIKLGGEIRFNSQLQDIKIKENKISSVIVNDEELKCENLILAIGHSARDTYEMLFDRGVMMTPKPFAIGVRMEHKQSLINENQYGKYADHPKLREADYKLTYNSKITNRSLYSFCMCPGGYVVGASSEENRLVVNGMSYHNRNGENANSAIVVGVGENDFLSNSPLSGIEFQRHYEELAYKCGGGNYKAPVQLVGDFLQDRKSTKIGSIKPTYKPGYQFADMRDCLPDYVIDTLKDGILNFDRKIRGFAANDVVMTGIETRTSAPVRINRNELGESIAIKGLYPAGEGAGYAGGIMSAAVDGIKIAENIVKEYKPF